MYTFGTNTVADQKGDKTKRTSYILQSCV